MKKLAMVLAVAAVTLVAGAQFLGWGTAKIAHAQMITDTIHQLKVSPSSLTYHLGDKGTQKITIKLAANPALPDAPHPTIHLEVDANTLIFAPVTLVDKSTLTFTEKNWNVAQTVTITYDPEYKLPSNAGANFKPAITYDGNFTYLKAIPVSGGGSRIETHEVMYTTTIPITLTGSSNGSSGGNGGGSSGSGSTGSTGTNTANAGPAGFGAPLVTLLADSKGFVYISWAIVRTAINSLLIIALLLISFTNILRINIDTYTVKKALPNLVIGVILANASFLVVKYLADIASVATYFFVGLAAGNGHPAGFYHTFTAFFADTMAALGIDSIKTVGQVAGLASPILLIIFIIIALVLILWLAFLLYFRLVAIYLLTILAPLAFVAYGIPGLEKYFKQWWQQFVKWLFILPAMCAVFWLMLVIHNSTLAANGTSNNSIAQLLIMYVLFVMALSLPSKLGGTVIDKASKAFQKYTGVDAGRKYLGEEAKKYGNLALTHTPVARIQEWNKLRKENFDKNLANRRKAAGVRARGGTAGLREGQLAHEEGIVGNLEAARKAERSETALTTQIANQLNTADLQKTTAEKFKERKQIEERIKFLARATEKKVGPDGKPVKDASGNDVFANPAVKEIIDNFSEATSRSSALAEAVKTQETIITGDYTNPRLGMLKRANLYRKEKDREEEDRVKLSKGEIDQNTFNLRAGIRQGVLDQLTAAFNEDKVKHPSLAGEDIQQMAAAFAEPAQKAILENEMKKQSAAFNAGVDGQMKDMRETGSVRLLFEENKETLEKLSGVMDKIASGQTAGVNVSQQRDAETIINPLKYWMANNRNPNYTEAIKKSLELLVKQGKQELKYVEGKGKNAKEVTITNDNLEEYLSGSKKIEGLQQDVQRSIVTTLNQSTMFGGSSAQHIAASPITPDVPPEPTV